MSGTDKWLERQNAIIEKLLTAMGRGLEELYKKLDEKARNDLEENNVFWNRFEGKTAEVSTKVNDTYLKAHSQTDGVLSYGRMVDLMLADYYPDAAAD